MNKIIEPVFEKGYPCYEAVNREEAQEHYWEYIMRRMKELREEREKEAEK